MTRNASLPNRDIVNTQGASALLAATLEFLRRNNIPKRQILNSIRHSYDGKPAIGNVRQYKKQIRAYEEMGIVMSTWFTSPRFIDGECRPIPLSADRGRKSVLSLLRTARVSIAPNYAVELMRCSPSVETDISGKFIALRSVFVLPDFEVPRAALVIERYLDTLQRNSSAKRNKTVLLLERNCHVPEVNLKTIAPILRDIKGRGTAFINSVNGDIEGNRLKKSGQGGVGEMSVHLFAWTRPSRIRRTRTKKSSVELDLSRQ